MLRLIKKLFSSNLPAVPDKEQVHTGIPLEKRLENWHGERKRLNTPLCFAPFRNIYFGNEGKITTCCYNREHVLGTWPEGSIEEIWFGEKALELREAMFEQDLSKGCQSCEFLLESKNHEALKISNYEDLPDHPKGYPTVMEFELSNICNLECVMCSGNYAHLIRKNREGRAPMKLPYNQDFTKQLEPFLPHLHTAKFYGGEPFLIDLYYDIWEKLMKVNSNVFLSIQTNGTVLNNRVRRLLEKTKVHFNISIDSFESETYAKIRKNGKLETVLKNLEVFHAHAQKNDTFFGISTCLMRQNWQEIPAIIRKCNELNAPIYLHTVFYPRTSSLQSMTEAQLLEVRTFLEKELQNLPESSEVEKKNRKALSDALGSLRNWVNSIEKEISLSEEPVDIAMEMEVFRKKLNGHLTEKFPSMTKREAEIEKISTILRRVITSLKEEDHQAGWKLLNAFPIQNVYEGVKSGSEAKLIEQSQIQVDALKEIGHLVIHHEGK